MCDFPCKIILNILFNSVFLKISLNLAVLLFDVVSLIIYCIYHTFYSFVMWIIINAFPLLLYLHQTRFSDTRSGQWVKGFKLWHFLFSANTHHSFTSKWRNYMKLCDPYLIFTFLQWKQQGWLYCTALNTSGWLWVNRKCVINSFISNINSCIYIEQHHQTVWLFCWRED